MKKLVILLLATIVIAIGSFVLLSHEKQQDPVNNVDRKTGVWYPPYTSQSDYDAHKATYEADVERAFKEDTVLGSQVCYELRHSGLDVTGLTPAAEQLRRILASKCKTLPSERAIAPSSTAHQD